MKYAYYIQLKRKKAHSAQSNDRTINSRQKSPKKIWAENNEQSRVTDTKK